MFQTNRICKRRRSIFRQTWSEGEVYSLWWKPEDPTCQTVWAAWHVASVLWRQASSSQVQVLRVLNAWQIDENLASQFQSETSSSRMPLHSQCKPQVYMRLSQLSPTDAAKALLLMHLGVENVRWRLYPHPEEMKQSCHRLLLLLDTLPLAESRSTAFPGRHHPSLPPP